MIILFNNTKLTFANLILLTKAYFTVCTELFDYIQLIIVDTMYFLLFDPFILCSFFSLLGFFTFLRQFTKNCSCCSRKVWFGYRFYPTSLRIFSPDAFLICYVLDDQLVFQYTMDYLYLNNTSIFCSKKCTRALLDTLMESNCHELRMVTRLEAGNSFQGENYVTFEGINQLQRRFIEKNYFMYGL